MTKAYKTAILKGSAAIHPRDDNVDVEVTFEDGGRFAATFFTLSNVNRILERYRKTGECKRGTYFWASDMIIVEQLTEAVIHDVIQDLIDQNEFWAAFSKLED